MAKTIYGFARHCMSDPEFNFGGIPTKEKDFVNALGLGAYQTNGELVALDDLNKFYEAICTLRDLHIKYDK